MPAASRALLLILCVAALCALPWLLPAGQLVAAVQMLIAALFACAFNLLAGQGGMLSFGHAAYFGVGTFATIHAMNALGGAGLLPTPLMPLVGGVAGLLFGLVAGWFATMRSGVYFSMITLALAELLHALAPHLKGVFGGEAGLSAMRMPAWGFSFGSDIEVYFLVLAWVLVSLAALYGLTRTPLGRLTLGLRENAHRLRYLGYRPHTLKTLVFALSAMFAGIAGGLQALNIEAGNYVLFDVKLSTDAVLFAYIGGVNAFLGPVLGASILTFLSQTLADITRSWLLYQGILFVLVMLFVPDGLVGLVQRAARSLRERGLADWLPRAAVSTAGGLLLTAGTVFTVELLQRMFARDYRSLLALNPDAGWPAISVFGRDWAPLALSTWLIPLALLVAGLVACRWALALWRDGDPAAPPWRRRNEPRHPHPHRRAQVLRRRADHPRREPGGARRRTPRGHRPQRRRQVHAVPPDVGLVRADVRRHQPAIARHRRPGARAHQPPGPGALVPDHQCVPAPVGAREPAAGGAAHARPGLHLLASHRAQPRRQRRRGPPAGKGAAGTAPARGGRRPELFGTALAGNRHDAGLAAARDPAGRAHGRHVAA